MKKKILFCTVTVHISDSDTHLPFRQIHFCLLSELSVSFLIRDLLTRICLTHICCTHTDRWRESNADTPKLDSEVWNKKISMALMLPNYFHEKCHFIMNERTRAWKNSSSHRACKNANYSQCKSLTEQPIKHDTFSEALHLTGSAAKHGHQLICIMHVQPICILDFMF